MALADDKTERNECDEIRGGRCRDDDLSVRVGWRENVLKVEFKINALNCARKAPSKKDFSFRFPRRIIHKLLLSRVRKRQYKISLPKNPN